jgi:hypothetical protein
MQAAPRASRDLFQAEEEKQVSGRRSLRFNKVQEP